MHRQPGMPRTARSHARVHAYDAHTTSVYEIIGSYFIDIVYNHLYNVARDRVVHGGTITQQYQQALRAYVQGVESDRSIYTRSVMGILERFRATTRFGSISMAQFIDEIMTASLPNDYYEMLHERERQQFMRVIVTRTVKEIVTIAAEPAMIRAIIDDHQNRGTVADLQNKLLPAMLAVRDEIFHKFLSQATGAKERSPDAELVRELRSALRTAAQERDALADALKTLKGRYAEAVREAAAARSRADKSEQLVALLVGRVKVLATANMAPLAGAVGAAGAAPRRAPADAGMLADIGAAIAKSAPQSLSRGEALGGGAVDAAANNPFGDESDDSAASDADSDADSDDGTDADSDAGSDSGNAGSGNAGSGNAGSDSGSSFDLLAVVDE